MPEFPGAGLKKQCSQQSQLWSLQMTTL